MKLLDKIFTTKNWMYLAWLVNLYFLGKAFGLEIVISLVLVIITTIYIWEPK